MNIYYFHPLATTFTSAQTVQLVRTYKNMGVLGHRTFIYGTWRDANEAKELEESIRNTRVTLLSRPEVGLNRQLLKFQFLYRAMTDPARKVMVTRNVDKAREIARFRQFLGPVRTVTEMHHQSFPYLLKRRKTKAQFARAMAVTDLVVFLSRAQTVLYRKEFGTLPSHHVVLPSGAETDRYKDVQAGTSGALTYVGQFSEWKNVELLFQALALLEPPLHLRIAGGKNNELSRRYIHDLTTRYSLKGRVKFLGYVPPEQVPQRVLAGSSALLLPLGDNLESRYLTSPVKLFEYMATGIPVVAVDMPSVREMVGPDAIYLAPLDPQAYAEAILHALGDTERTAKIALMNRIAQNYSHENRARRFQAALIALWSGSGTETAA